MRFLSMNFCFSSQGFAPRRTTARIDIEYYIAAGGQIAHLVKERKRVLSAGTAVDFQNRRIPAPGIESGRSHQPALDISSIERFEPDLAGSSGCDFSLYERIQVSQPSGTFLGAIRSRTYHYVTRIFQIAVHQCRGPSGAAHREPLQVALAFVQAGRFASSGRDRIEIDRAGIRTKKEYLPTIGRPFQVSLCMGIGSVGNRLLDRHAIECRH
jgi:hypothetical protein